MIVGCRNKKFGRKKLLTEQISLKIAYYYQGWRQKILSVGTKIQRGLVGRETSIILTKSLDLHDYNEWLTSTLGDPDTMGPTARRRPWLWPKSGESFALAFPRSNFWGTYLPCPSVIYSPDNVVYVGILLPYTLGSWAVLLNLGSVKHGCTTHNTATN